ncbi:MAG: hypothetical protein OIN85_00355 [Candidatus Methanoperedens sp.]|nr:hypothetical protein [Candidatus Methanoperedens sp.]
MAYKEKEWNFYFTGILLFFTVYTVIKDVFISGFVNFYYALIGALFVTTAIIFLIKRQIE